MMSRPVLNKSPVLLVHLACPASALGPALRVAIPSLVPISAPRRLPRDLPIASPLGLLRRLQRCTHSSLFCARTFSLSDLKGTCTMGKETRCSSARERAVAQLGSALEWGSRGRGFESRQPDFSIFRRGCSLRRGSRGMKGYLPALGDVISDLQFNILQSKPNLECSPKIDPRAMRVYAAEAPVNSNEAKKKEQRRNHQETTG